LAEVAGDGALLVDPTDLAGAVEALVQALTDAGVINTLRERGYKNVARFEKPSWMAAYRKLYNEILSE